MTTKKKRRQSRSPRNRRVVVPLAVTRNRIPAHEVVHVIGREQRNDPTAMKKNRLQRAAAADAHANAMRSSRRAQSLEAGTIVTTKIDHDVAAAGGGGEDNVSGWTLMQPNPKPQASTRRSKKSNVKMNSTLTPNRRGGAHGVGAVDVNRSTVNHLSPVPTTNPSSLRTNSPAVWTTKMVATKIQRLDAVGDAVVVVEDVGAAANGHAVHAPRTQPTESLMTILRSKIPFLPPRLTTTTKTMKRSKSFAAGEAVADVEAVRDVMRNRRRGHLPNGLTVTTMNREAVAGDVVDRQKPN
mgnify:CR=1 FL=1